MSGKPIIMAGTNVKALIDGRKTQTRRLIPEKMLEAYYAYDDWCGNVSGGVPSSRQWEQEYLLERLRIQVGDRLYIREHWRTHKKFDEDAPRDLNPDTDPNFGLKFEADGEERHWVWGRFRQAMHMPRWASRITLQVTNVRVQKLQDISTDDAIAEGLRWIKYEELFPDGGDPQYAGTGGWECHKTYPDGTPHPHNIAPLKDPRKAYEYLWDTLHRKDAPWESNPWVVAYTFTVELKNIDER